MGMTAPLIRRRRRRRGRRSPHSRSTVPRPVPGRCWLGCSPGTGASAREQFGVEVVIQPVGGQIEVRNMVTFRILTWNPRPYRTRHRRRSVVTTPFGSSPAIPSASSRGRGVWLSSQTTTSSHSSTSQRVSSCSSRTLHPGHFVESMMSCGSLLQTVFWLAELPRCAVRLVTGSSGIRTTSANSGHNQGNNSGYPSRADSAGGCDGTVKNAK